MPASLITLNENVLTALDVETTGRDPFYNEVIQVALVPLDINLNPVGTPFYTDIRPEFPDRMAAEATAAHGISLERLDSAPDSDTASDYLWEWFQSLKLLPGKRLIPLAHNCQFDIPFLQKWLGLDQFYEVFGYPTRDTQALITALQDKDAYKNQAIKFKQASLAHACATLGITLDNAHDALADAIATSKVYKALLNIGVW